ncbi:PREDICTED: potassium voltage-gated channel subfamily H member 2-like [Acropora digitifera]|uniref:potassium voltage-gated channel subfamily H member 2-like n=1 Tax=Acropora digitifera TaxID=70779 RepID=UPI00077A8C8C|nr:PREDICTED: potassium voltage-gated channel subfamily H member 2-like [Acropora digitifera]
MSVTSKISFHSFFCNKHCLIRHDSIFKIVWDWFILALVIYTAVEVPFDMAFLVPARKSEASTSQFGSLKSLSPIAVANLLVDLFFIIDIPINFRSAVIVKDTYEVITNAKRIAILYLKSWFLVDFVAAIPLDFFAHALLDLQATTLTGLLKTARLLRLVRVTRKIDRYSEYGVAAIFLLMCLFTLTSHWLACVWHAIGQVEARDNTGWLAALADEIGKPINESNLSSGPSLSIRYISSLYFTLSSLTTVGFGNIAPSTNDEKIFVVFVMIMGALMYASIFGNLTVILQRLCVQSSKQHGDLHLIREFAKFHKIPTVLKEIMEDHVLQESLFVKADDLQTVLKMFPSTLQTDICLHIHDELLRHNSAFRAAVPSCKRSLASKLKVQHFLPRQYIVKQGDPVDKVIFILKGTVDVIGDGQKIVAIGRGDTVYCDDNSIKNKSRATASLLVQAHTLIHYIDWTDLSSILRDFPSFREDFLTNMMFSFQIGTLRKENNEGFSWELEPVADRHFVKPVEPAKSDEEGYRLNQSQATGTKSTDLNDLIENVKLMDQRLLNLERKISLVIPLLRKALKDKI